MTKLVLLGDSIRLGYQATVVRELGGVAEVWAPAENGQHSVNLLLNFTAWVVARRPDVLHLNAGLWDTRNVRRGRPGNVVPLSHYRENVRTLLTLAREVVPTVVWATATPVNEADNLAHHAATGQPGRVAADVPRYNEAAVEIAAELGVPVNDLHRLVADAGPDTMLLPDGVHYSPDAYEALGKRVADFVRPML